MGLQIRRPGENMNEQSNIQTQGNEKHKLEMNIKNRIERNHENHKINVKSKNGEKKKEEKKK